MKCEGLRSYHYFLFSCFYSLTSAFCSTPVSCVLFPSVFNYKLVNHIRINVKSTLAVSIKYKLLLSKMNTKVPKICQNNN
jgi:hypothetical protein